MNFFKRFVASIYKFDEYGSLIDSSMGSSMGYYIVFSLIIICLTCISVFTVMDPVIDALVEKVPDFRIEDGQLLCDEDLNYDFDGQVIIKLDADAESAKELESGAGDYISGIFVSKNDILINQKITGQQQTTPFEGIDSFERSDFLSFMDLMKTVYKAMIVVMFILFKAVFLLFLGCLGKLMSNIFRGGLTFGAAVRLGIYSSTFAVLLRCILMFVLPGGLPSFIFYGIILVYMYLGIINYKKKAAAVV